MSLSSQVLMKKKIEFIKFSFCYFFVCIIPLRCKRGGGGGFLPRKYGRSTGNSAKYCTSEKGVKYFEVRVLFNNHGRSPRKLVVEEEKLRRKKGQ